MFKVTQKDTPELKVMFVECDCAKRISFAGDVCPIVCPHCSRFFPDALSIHQNNEERVIYHIDKEIWD